MGEQTREVAEGKLVEASAPVPANRTPLVFISHDTRDTELAKAFADLLRSVSSGVLKSFISSDKKSNRGMEYGTDWFPAIMSKLDEASDVVALLTKRSLDRPWILYEAGVARGKYDTPVLGLALGIPLEVAQRRGPFAQFQNSGDDEDSVTGVVLQLIKRIPGSDPDLGVVAGQVQRFKEDAADILGRLDESIEDKADEPNVDSGSVARLFEEVKVMFEDLSTGIDRRLREVTPRGDRRLKHMHPMMFEEMMHFGSRGGRGLGWLFIISYVKDDLPWAYELGLEVYRALKGGRRERVQTAMHDFENAVEFAMQMPFFEEMGLRSRDSMRSLDMLRHAMHQFAEHQAVENN